MTVKSTSIKISIGQNTVRVSAFYKSPSWPLTTSDIQTLTNDCDWSIVTRDLNAKHPLWHSRHVNAIGSVLYPTAQQTDFIVFAPDSPTFYPKNNTLRPDVLDVELVRLRQLLTEVTNINDLSSDHNPIFMHVSDLIVTSFPPSQLAESTRSNSIHH